MKTLMLSSARINLEAKSTDEYHRVTVAGAVKELHLAMSDDDVVALRDALNDLLPLDKRYRRVYKYRNYRADVVPNDKLWCVVGGLVDSNEIPRGGGVLEWCTDEEDAKNILRKMQGCEDSQGDRFTNLSAEKYR